MHYLDSLIDDIEPRIQSILDVSPTISETTIQTSLISYCWILLDSWIAWNTYRFLLRDSLLDQDVPEKWIRTPSSYSYSQIQSIWKFGKEPTCFFENETGESLKNAIDTTIQSRRNASAHFSRDIGNKVRGDDIRRIKTYFDSFSKLFRFVEIKKMFESLSEKFFMKYNTSIDCYSFDDGEKFPHIDFDIHFNEFLNCSLIKCHFVNKDIISFEKECKNAFYMKYGKEERILISTDDYGFNLFGNKGYYTNTSPILESMARIDTGE